MYDTYNDAISVTIIWVFKPQIITMRIAFFCHFSLYIPHCTYHIVHTTLYIPHCRIIYEYFQGHVESTSLAGNIADLLGISDNIRCHSFSGND